MMLFYKLYQPLWSHFFKFNINIHVLSKQSYSTKIVDLRAIITKNICEEMESDLSIIKWKSIRENILQENTKITPSIVDSVIIDMCVKHFHVNNAIAYFKFLKENNYSLNAGVIGKYLKLYVLKRNSLTDADKIEIVKTYNDLRQKYQYLDSVTAEECIMSLCLTNEWEKTQDIIEMMKITSSPGTAIYSALANAAFRNGKPDIAWKALTNIVLRKLIPQKHVYLSHLQYCQLEDAKFFNNRMEEMFHFWSKHNIIPYNQIIRAYANTAIKYGWSTDRITISKKTGNCKHCGYFLSKITLSEDEFQELVKFVMDRIIIGSDIYNKTNPKELLKFKEFIENTKPFDVIIDGLNLAYMNFSSPKLLTLISVVEHFKNRGKKVLVLTRKHQRKLFEFKRVERNAFVFLVDNLSADDPYILYATMVSGMNAMFVSSDFMRQQKHSLQNDDLQQKFKKWQISHQYVIKSSATGIRIQDPFTYLPIVQKSDNCWHVPCLTEDLNKEILKEFYEFSDKWYCFKYN
ncbi:Mitochondrial ribonuclease P protein 3 [Trachymyrmex septentrionalis]|uniref:Mitochondrial ribonuclease P catalytic subunit n=1 Tax=Trachymyrmex septentrionalis TaxID=34720 RepID=A0A195F307_9HYME|nr:PREDICTED: mitochondrial ribonuclease P protein 3 [Trachymyrmex septentrionalis]XP_018348832.1 PREDICTED: mitochondrial ribonuclease P protein 3 [Trachymyrmex septentrionalis]KYN34469.1 Mitochondrial ribonuclease P protein 3 [Trachymyrmex septentrionalis]